VKVQSGAIADPVANTTYNGNMSVTLSVYLYRRYVETYSSFNLIRNATESIGHIFYDTKSFLLIEVGETKIITFTISKDKLVKPSQKYVDERFFLDMIVGVNLEEFKIVSSSDELEIGITYFGQSVGWIELEINDLISQFQRYSVDAEKYSRWYYETLANLDSQKSITSNLQSQITSLQQEESVLNEKITDLQTEVENYKVQNFQLESEKGSINTRVSDLTNYVIIETVAIMALIAILIIFKMRSH
jgi:predicted DNA binding CopG/RHH family protein